MQISFQKNTLQKRKLEDNSQQNSNKKRFNETPSKDFFIKNSPEISNDSKVYNILTDIIFNNINKKINENEPKIKSKLAQQSLNSKKDFNDNIKELVKDYEVIDNSSNKQSNFEKVTNKIKSFILNKGMVASVPSKLDVKNNQDMFKSNIAEDMVTISQNSANIAMAIETKLEDVVKGFQETNLPITKENVQTELNNWKNEKPNLEKFEEEKAKLTKNLEKQSKQIEAKFPPEMAKSLIDQIKSGILNSVQTDNKEIFNTLEKNIEEAIISTKNGEISNPNQATIKLNIEAKDDEEEHQAPLGMYS